MIFTSITCDTAYEEGWMAATKTRAKTKAKKTSKKQSAPVATTEAPESPLISNARLKQIYATMLKCRMFEEKSRIALDKQHSAENFKAAIGHEAALVGVALELTKGDAIFSPQIEFVSKLVQGAAIKAVLGDAIKTPTPNFDASLQLTLQAARDFKKKKSKKIALAYADDHSAKIDGWQQAMKTAGELRLPMIFVHQSDLFRNSVATATNNQNAGLPTITVDGNDAVAVYRVAQESMHRARSRSGPVLIECLTYRWHHNSLPTDAAFWETKDPILRMKLFLQAKGLFSDEWAAQLQQDFQRELTAAEL